MSTRTTPSTFIPDAVTLLGRVLLAAGGFSLDALRGRRTVARPSIGRPAAA